MLYHYPTSKGLGSPFMYAIAAILCVFLESISSFDIFFQVPFFHDGKWLLSTAFHEKWKFLLYTAPKVIIGIIGSSFFLLSWASVFLKKIVPASGLWQKSAFLVAVSIAIIPLFVSILKATTGIYSPIDLQQFGGEFNHVGFVEQVWVHGHLAGGRSFPTGHASGGFSLIALFYLPVSRFWKRMFLGVGLSAGWLMGLYQMARGEHFMSHTLTTMFIAFTMVTCTAKKLRLQV